MRILFTTDQIYLHGGIEKVMAEKANYFADVFDYDVHILTTEQNGNAPCYRLSEKIKKTDISVNYHRKKSYFHPANLLKLPQHFRQWRKAIRTIDPDVVIVCNYAFDFYWSPFFFTRISKLKEFHSSGFLEMEARKNAGFFGKIRFGLQDFIESKYDRIVVLNPSEAQFCKSKNTVVIPNPIGKTDKVAALKNKKAIAAGRIAPVKGFTKAIDAWALAMEYQSDWELYIYGQGEPDYIQMLKAKIVNQGLQNNIFIKPATENLDDEMAGASMYVMSSVSECFPMVLLEALSAGLPIASFDCPTGPGNIITDGEDGFLAEDQNIASLAEKIVILMTDEDLRKEMGKCGRSNAQRFSNEAVMNLWQSLFNELKNKSN
ncbi:MAG TPA: glycosyltransferase family 4 protein [Flavobacterium sp.]|nr:glycosyltransferase family 4 protein [Flavobacterium sp.]